MIKLFARKTTKMSKCMLLALIGLSGTLSAEALDEAQFQMRAQLAVKGYTGSTTLADFPVLVRLSKGRPLEFTYAEAGENGANLRFADAGGNLIPHEVDTWNPSGESLVWVKLPTLPANGTNFWMYSSPVAGGSLPAVSPTDVWSKYVAVMHGNEFADSSPSGLAVANGVAVVAGDADAVVGKSYGKTQRNAVGLNLANPWTAGKFTTNGKMTVSGWMKFGDTGYTHVWFSSVYKYGDTGSISYWARGPNNNKGWVEVNVSGKVVSGTQYPTLPYNAWNHVAIAYDDTSMSLYHNGGCQQENATVNKLGDTSQSYWTFGSYANMYSDDSFQGLMDELRIYDGTASADWIKAEYDSAHDKDFVGEIVDETRLGGRATLAVRGYTGSSTLSDFPVLVRIGRDRPFGFDYAAAGEDGAGLRFADAEGNRIPHEVDTWNPSGESLVWVKLPALPADGTHFKMAWSPVVTATPPELAATNVWSKYVAVMHGNEFADSSPSGLAVANGGKVEVGYTDAVVGKSYGKTQRNAVGLNLANPWTAGKFTTNGKMTVSGWMKFGDTGYTHVWFSSVCDYGATGSISYWARGANNDKGWVEVNVSGKVVSGTQYPTLPYNAWNHVAIAYDDTSMSLYHNGGCQQENATVNKLGDTSQSYWTFGSYANKYSDDSFQGLMDELRIYDGTASADWIKAEYDSAHNANFVEEIVDETLFAHRCDFAVPGYRGASTLEDFPVLVRVRANSPANFAYADAGSDGAGLRFADGEGHPLAFEIDTWDPAGESLVWVRLPSLSGSLTTFKMLWGASDLDELPGQAPRSTWSKYVAVMHGNEFVDSSPGGLAVAGGGAVLACDTDAVVGKSYKKTDYTQVGLNFTNPWTAGKFTTNGKMTVSGWMKFVDTRNTHVWFSSVYTFGDKGSISYWGRDGSLEVNTSGSIAGDYWNTGLTYGVWNHVAVAHDNTSMSLYLNGICKVSSAVNALGDTYQPYWTFGSYAGRGSNDSFQGVMDELRIYDGTASADWIAAEYDSAHNRGFVTELADDAPVTAIWTGKGAAGNADDPQNWECRNLSDEVITNALPRADLTTIKIGGGVSGFSVPDVAACRGRRYLVGDATLSGDCDWTGCADRLEFAGTLNLNGRTLTVADLPGAAGVIVGPGTLRVTTAGTATIQTELTGALSLVKAGAGTLIAARADQSYTGGTTVEAGILRFAAASAPAGALTGKITVKDGGAVDLYAKAGLAYPYEIEGNGPEGRGALYTSLDQNNWYATWMGDVVLSGDASLGSGIVCNGHTLTLNKHVLFLNADAAYKVVNSREVLFQNARVTDEGVIRVLTGRISSLPHDDSGENDTFVGERVTLELLGTDVSEGLIARGRFRVEDLVYSSMWQVRSNAARVFVSGRYRPDSTALPAVVLTGPEAMLDLSAKTGVFVASTGEGLAFDDNAVVTLALGAREIVNGEQLVSWTKPANLDTLKFRLAKPLSEKYYLRANGEGIFIYRSGLIIMVK